MGYFIPGVAKFKKDGRKKFVVVGCGRSGTLYMSKVFEELGYAVGHEGFLADGISSWYVVEKTRAQAVNEIIRKLDGTNIVSFIHLIRNPLDVISSMMRCELLRNRSALDFFARSNPEFNNLEMIERCARYWVVWNRFIQERFPVDYLLKVDEMPDKLREFCSAMKIRLYKKARKNIEALGREYHAISGRHKVNLIKAYGENVFRRISLEECGGAANDVLKIAKRFNCII